MEFFCTVITIMEHVAQNGSNGRVLVGASESAYSMVGYSPEDPSLQLHFIENKLSSYWRVECDAFVKKVPIDIG